MKMNIVFFTICLFGSSFLNAQFTPNAWGLYYNGGGKVGIGTNQPAHNLDIIADYPSFRIRAENSNNTKDITINPNDNNIEAVHTDLYLNRFSNHKVVFAAGGGNVIMGVNQTPAGTGDGTIGGNVGIGTVGPTCKLDIVDNYPRFRIRAETNNKDITIDPNDQNIEAVHTDLYLNRFSTQNIILTAGGGSVGIGTSNLPPDYKLAVKGGIITDEVRVELEGDGLGVWPDYVFKSNYHLATLEEVETHIQTKGHLPNIPSAAEVEEDGLALGDMQRRMMEKIEELTLYLIEQNKQIKALQVENVRLKLHMESFQK